jgi:uncharacterized membrane protein YkvA (DUF1232 family)
MESQKLQLNLTIDVSDYNGEHSAIIRKLPAIYDLAVKLLRDVMIDSTIRQKLLAGIGYLVIPNDLFPEDEHGPIGYVEDIMLLIHIFRLINTERGKTPLVRNWSRSEDELKEMLTKDFEELKNSFPLLFEEVIKFTGV